MERVEIDVPVAAGVRAGCGCLSAVVVFSAFVAVVTVLAGASSESVGQVAVTIALFAALPVAITAALWLLVVKRTRTWLEGSYLVRRATLRTTRIELPAVEEVYLETLPDVRSDIRTPVLVIKDASTGPVRLPLKSARGWLPPGQLHALADRIQAGGRHEKVVGEMRELADVLERNSGP